MQPSRKVKIQHYVLELSWNTKGFIYCNMYLSSPVTLIDIVQKPNLHLLRELISSSNKSLI